MACLETQVAFVDNNGAFTDGSGWKISDMKIEVDSNVITIHSAELLTYRLFEGHKTDDNIYKFRGIDNDGKSCNVRVIVYNQNRKTTTEKDYNTCLYIDYKDFTIAYRTFGVPKK